jgi:1,2-diacylglycerol 3-alpha-glucosyltransferase
MRILMLCELYIENLEYQENLLVKYYVKHGHDVTVITSTYDDVFDYYNNKHDNSKPRKEYYDHGAKIIKLPFKYNFFGKIKKYTNISNIVEEFKPDLLYIHDIMPNMFEMLDYKKRNPNVKMIMDYHADFSNSANGWLSLIVLHKLIRKYVFMNPIKKHISKFYPIIPASKYFLNKVYGIENEKMEILPLGADVDLINELKIRGIRGLIREKLCISNDDFVVFSGGKFEPQKKNHLLFQAFNQLNNKKLHLIIVGDADSKNQDYKKQLVALANNNSNIHFTGWINSIQIYEYMQASDAAVFPSSQSIIWLQAIASELPIIIGDCGEQSLDYINEFNAIIELDKNEINSKNIKTNLKRLMEDNAFYLEKKLATIKTTENYLNWNYLINSTLKFNKN